MTVKKLLKKSLILTISFIFLASLLLINTSAVEVEGYIRISTKYDLDKIKDEPNKNYYLACDIDFTYSDFVASGDFYGGLDAIENFSGILDGCGHRITGLIYSDNYSYGLTVQNNGIIKNLELYDCDFSKSPFASTNYGTIYNCKVTNSTALNAGIVETNNGLIKYCSVSETKINGEAGIARYNNDNGIIDNCINYTDIDSNDRYVSCFSAGITARNYGLVSNCINKGYINQDTKSGGIVADNSGIIYNCVNLGNVKTINHEAAGITVGSSTTSSQQYIENCINKGTISTKYSYNLFPISNYNQFQQINCIDCSSGAKEEFLEIETESESGITAFKYPTKTNYNLNEELNVTDMQVMSLGSLGNWELTKNYTVTGGAYKRGKNVVTVTSTVNTANKFSFNIYAYENIADQSIEISKNSYIYTGKAIKPTITVTSSDGRILIENRDYSLNYSNNINAGTATVKITGLGFFNGSKTIKYTIVPKKINTLKISGITSKVYTGKALTLSLTLKDGTKTLAKTNYTTKYSNNIKLGIAKVTITGRGNYTGSITKTFNIIPKGTYISNLTVGNKQITVSWKKQTINTTGYQLQYATSSSFSGAKIIKISNTKQISRIIKNLNNSKTYYLRIRTYKTIKGRTYYSDWSSSKVSRYVLPAAIKNALNQKAGTIANSNYKITFEGYYQGGEVYTWAKTPGIYYHFTPNQTYNTKPSLLTVTTAKAGLGSSCTYSKIKKLFPNIKFRIYDNVDSFGKVLTFKYCGYTFSFEAKKIQNSTKFTRFYICKS